jgi:hypothetical protein
MAALATQNVAAGGAITTAAATGGGDTIQAGTSVGGWSLPVYLYATVGATATTITVGGVAHGPFTNQTVLIPVSGGYRGGRVNITYNQVTAVAVGAVSTAPGGILPG